MAKQKKDANYVEPVVDNEAGTAVDVEAVMRKYDRESNVRIWEGKPKIVVSLILAAFSLFCIYVTLFANFLEQVRLTSFMGLIIIMGYLTYPVKKGSMKVNHLPWYDIILMVLGAGAFFFFTFNADKVLNTRLAIKLRDPMYTIIGVVGILTLAELCRRCVGLPILFVAGAFIIYTFSTGQNLARVSYELFFGENGILSMPVSVCSKYIVVFIIFGAFLERTGIADFFISFANCIAGAASGGPAKVAVIASALEGMVSGSSVANTVGSGSITIPMMKKLGYKPEFAGAVEAAASTGGQIMPPIMGAAAFLMADYIGVPYSDIIGRAILPAALYFLGIFIAVHLEAKKCGLKGISRDQLPRVKALIKDTYLLLPMIILVYLVTSNTRTMQFSASVAILSAVAVGLINNVIQNMRRNKAEGKKNSVGDSTKALIGLKGGFTGKSILESLEAGGRGTITVGVACGVAGIICGCITVTGLASKMINVIIGIAGNSTMLGLLLTMICCIVLGMGVPTTANYCIMASTCAPILIQMDVPVMAAHFFVFYFGIVADITPPVALAAYAGSAIAKSNPMKTALTATRLAIAAFIIPFVFAYSPSMLMVDANVVEIIVITVTSILGMVGIAAGLSGYLARKMGIVERLLAVVGGLLLVIPGTVTDICGMVCIIVVVVIQFIRAKRPAKA